MNISITINGNSAVEIQDEMRALLAGEAQTRPAPITGGVSGEVGSSTEPPKMTAAQRKAAEKAAKEAAEAAAKQAISTGEERTDPEAAKQAISTGEERTDPEADKQDAADEAADTAREAAEVAAKAATANKPVDLTHDDVKKLLGGYVQAYGMAAAQEDGTAFIFAPKISEIPNTQAALAKAIIGIAQAIEKNPKNRDVSGDGLTPEKTAELKTIVAAAMAVK